jgi:uncharacterized protein (DUF2235 family)
MVKNIVVCCDGTANEFAKNRTNVIKLYSTLVHDTDAQVAYYHPGIGTMEPFGALSPLTRTFTRLLGMAVGYGLENDIRDAYVFLIRTYEPGDRIYLFGFSRGAFTVRAVASLISMYGMIRKDNETLVPYAIRMLTGIQRAGTNRAAAHEYFALADEFKRTMSCGSPDIHFVGIWDTVSSVGWIDNPLHLPFEANNPDIEVGRHAVAIDERRAFFRSHLWQLPKDPGAPRGPVDLQQVWFPGVHCDVGGGYPEETSGLSKCALDWMLQEAKAHGLIVDPVKEAEVLGLTGSGRYVPAAPEATSLGQLAKFGCIERLDAVREIACQAPPDNFCGNRAGDLVEVRRLARHLGHRQVQRLARQAQRLKASRHHDAGFAFVVGKLQNASSDEKPLEPRNQATHFNTTYGDLHLRRLKQARFKSGALNGEQSRGNDRRDSPGRRAAAVNRLEKCGRRRRWLQQLVLSRRELVLDILESRLQHLCQSYAACAVLFVATLGNRERHDDQIATSPYQRPQGTDVPDERAEQRQAGA